MNRIAVLPILAVALALPATAQRPRVLSKQATILTGSAAKRVLRPCSRGAVQNVQGYWTPTAADIARLEAALPAFLDAEKMPRAARKRGIKSDLHQCAGFVRGSRQWVYVNAFSRRHAEEMRRVQTLLGKNKAWNWRRDAADVCDGGSDFWGVEYDVRAGTFRNLQFSGTYAGQEPLK